MSQSLLFVERFFNSLNGEWSFCRQVNGVDMMKGQAFFRMGSKEAKFYVYREEGIYIPQGLKSLSFFKEYIYTLNQDIIEIYGAVQRRKQHFLHTLDFAGTSIGKGVHVCGADRYEARCDILSDTCFRMLYRVEGPRKRYLIMTFFERI